MRYQGIAVVPGISHGALWAPRASVAEAPFGLEAFDAARLRFVAGTAALPDDLRTMYDAVAFDPAWDEGIERHLASGVSLVDSITATAAEIAGMLASLDDPYLRARNADFIQIGAQLVRLLGTPDAPVPESILCARDVSAVELAQWSSHLTGIVLIDVPPTAHVAIVARGLALPTVALAGTGDDLYRSAQRGGDGAALPSLLNGFEGWLETLPDNELRERYPAARIGSVPDPATVFAHGRTLGVYANVNLADEAGLASALGADGIGLLRTEFLYVGRTEQPPLEEERAAFSAVGAAFARGPIVVRTMDLGGDKSGLGIENDGLDHGMLGVRGIRLSLRRPDSFVQHAQAIVEGFAGSDLRLMFPMVTVPEEFRRARELVSEAVRRAGTPMPPLGVMVEVPAAAYAFDAFAREGASFVSFGTNDLAQYFFASDRLRIDNSSLDPASNPAFRSFVAEAIARAKAAGLETCVCGEAAGWAAMTSFWLACGVDELSVAPALVPWLKARLRTALTIPAKEVT